MNSPTSISLANNFLNISFKEGRYISPMKLQRLLYFTYKEYLKRTKKKLFDEPFETWEKGPVLVSLQKEISFYKDKHITDYIYSSPNSKTFYDIELNSNLILFEIVLANWNKYKYWSPTEMSNQIKLDKNSAWNIACKNDNPVLKTQDIYNEKIY